MAYNSNQNRRRRGTWMVQVVGGFLLLNTIGCSGGDGGGNGNSGPVTFDDSYFEENWAGVSDAVVLPDGTVAVAYKDYVEPNYLTVAYADDSGLTLHRMEPWQDNGGPYAEVDSKGRILLGDPLWGTMVRFSKGLKAGFFPYEVEYLPQNGMYRYAYNTAEGAHYYTNEFYTSFDFTNHIELYKKSRDEAEELVATYAGLAHKLRYSPSNDVLYFLYDEQVGSVYTPKMIQIGDTDTDDLGFPANTTCLDFDINSEGHPVGLFKTTEELTGDVHYQVHSHLGSVWQLNAEFATAIPYAGKEGARLILDNNDVPFIAFFFDYNQFEIHKLEAGVFTQVASRTDVEDNFDFVKSPNTGHMYLAYPIAVENKVKILEMTNGTAFADYGEYAQENPGRVFLRFDLNDDALLMVVVSENDAYLLRQTGGEWATEKHLYNGVVSYMSFVFDNDETGRPTLAYKYPDCGNGCPSFRLLQWRTEDYWEFEDLGSFSTGPVFFDAFDTMYRFTNFVAVTSEDEPLMLYFVPGSGEVHVMRMDADGTWTDLGNPGGFTNPNNMQLAVDENDAPVVFLARTQDSNPTGKVYRWDGGTEWTDLAFPGFHTNLFLKEAWFDADASGNLYLTSVGDWEIETMRYDGTDWTDLGDANVYAYEPREVIMATGPEGPYVVYRTDFTVDSWQVPMVQYTGSGWQNYGQVTHYTVNLDQTVEGMIVVDSHNTPSVILNETYEYNHGWYLYQPVSQGE